MLDAAQIPIYALGGLTEEDAAIIARANAEVQRLAQTAYRYEAEQTEDFLAEHIDLKDTHVLGVYSPILVEGPDKLIAWAVPKVLLPIGGEWPLTYEAAQNAGLPTTQVMRFDIALEPPPVYPRTPWIPLWTP